MWLLPNVLYGICSSQSIDSIWLHLYSMVVFGIVLNDASLANTCREYVGQSCAQTENVISCDPLFGRFIDSHVILLRRWLTVAYCTMMLTLCEVFRSTIAFFRVHLNQGLPQTFAALLATCYQHRRSGMNQARIVSYHATSNLKRSKMRFSSPPAIRQPSSF